MLDQATLQAIANEPYEARGILHSEMALIIHTCRKFGIEVFIESGRARGQSTYMLAKYLPDVEIHSTDYRSHHPDEAFARERLNGFRNVHLYEENGIDFLVLAARQLGPRRAAVLCDGPKGIFAVGTVEKCFRHPHVRVGFIHDMRRLDHGVPSPYRAAAEAVFPGALFSDDPAYVSETSWLDVNVRTANGPVGPEWEAKFGSYGPTIGVFLNTRS